MREYLFSFLALTLIATVVSFVAHKKSEQALRFVCGAVILAALVIPLFEILPRVDIGGIIEDIKNGSPDSPIYTERAEEAVEAGIAAAISERFSFGEGEVTVELSGFDFESMSADEIGVILSGGAIFADFRELEKFVTELGLGECEVSVEI